MKKKILFSLIDVAEAEATVLENKKALVMAGAEKERKLYEAKFDALREFLLQPRVVDYKAYGTQKLGNEA